MGRESVCDKSQIAMGMYVNRGEKKLRVYLRVLMKREEKDESCNKKKTKGKKRIVTIEDRGKG